MSETFEDTLFRFRQFELVPTYVGLINTLSAQEKIPVMKAFSTFVTSVLDSDFLTVRKSSVNNPHLKRLEGLDYCPEILQQWHDYKLDIAVPNERLDTNSITAAAAAPLKDERSPYFAMLVDKIKDHHHLEASKVPAVLNYFNDPSKKEAILDLLETKKSDPYSILQIYTIMLADGNTKILGDLLKYLEALSGKEAGLENYITDIRGFIALENKPKTTSYAGFKCSLTVDPCDYFLLGTEIPGSCQSIHAGVTTNKCLMGYALNGADRLLVIKDSSNKIVSRAILRLLWDEKERKPVLFQERIYSLKDEVLDNLLTAKAQQFAADLGIKYASAEIKYDNPLHSYGGQAPWEYVDAIKSSTNGRFVIV